MKNKNLLLAIFFIMAPIVSLFAQDQIQKLFRSSTAVFDVAEYGKNTRRIGMAHNPQTGDVEVTTIDTPFGKAKQTKAYFEVDGKFGYELHVRELENLDAYTIQAFFHNKSEDNTYLRAFDLFSMDRSFGGQVDLSKPEDWLVTPLMEHHHAETLAEMDKRFKEVGLFYNTATDNSFLLGPTGPGDAHCNVHVTKQKIRAIVRMDQVLVEPGEVRRSEEMIFIKEDKDKNIDVWTKWVAITHNAKLDRDPVYGWCSWYDRTTKIDEAHVMNVTKTIKENPNTFGRGIIQIDDGYQKMDGDWSANEKFPSGMANVAKEIRAIGATPGVWFAPLMINPEHPFAKANPDALQKNAKGIESFMNPNPFHPSGAKWLNPTNAKAKEFLFNIIKDARDRGFGYIKIDFNGIGAVYDNPKLTRLQTFRELYTLYREAAGDDMYILSCLGQPTRGVIGFIDAARVGPDSHPAHFSHCLESVLRFQIFHKVWWNNDADVSYLEYKLPSRRVGHTPQQGMWHTWHNTVALTGGTAMISEPIDAPDVKEVWRNYEIMRPGVIEQTKLLTLGKSPNNTVFGFTAKREFGDFGVYNLYNVDKEKENDVTINLVEAGLPKDTKCAVYDFWKNEVVGYATNTYTAEKLYSNSSQLVRFTPIEDDKLKVLGSNLHLSIGANEITKLTVKGSGVKVELSDAGAQEGDIIFFSKKGIQAGNAKNCKIKNIESLGNNLWKVTLSERKWDTKQSFSLKTVVM
ncbi:glycoside hydrolase family 36 protein [Flammeovirga agarivorans]|uniref:Alpha-galactosidase n=1 Tax=Flammeovirga agarivorans TaxID=2726742 RepID=A0A7X8SN79_9BACT|nr:glycoside hydrolase family 36 protein [Flammeovirga agarivorans]NLR93324.1 alpha-galactosidase [Flammeovirga agarivorans]